MTLLAIILALILEQLYPLGNRSLTSFVFHPYTHILQPYARVLEKKLNAGRPLHGLFIWFVAVFPFLLVAYGGHRVLATLHSSFSLMWDVAVLYISLGFQRFSRPLFTLQHAFLEQRYPDARTILHGWLQQPTAESVDPHELQQLTVQHAITDSYRHIFAVIFWFAVLPTPIGAVLYGCAHCLYKKWERQHAPFRIMQVLDYLPLRLVALSFALVGNFEDAIAHWRTHAHFWRTSASLARLQAAAFGALNLSVRPLEHLPTATTAPTFDPNSAPPNLIGRTRRLIWRSVILWLSILWLIS